jgi:hypothetical protein
VGSLPASVAEQLHGSLDDHYIVPGILTVPCTTDSDILPFVRFTIFLPRSSSRRSYARLTLKPVMSNFHDRSVPHCAPIPPHPHLSLRLTSLFAPTQASASMIAIASSPTASRSCVRSPSTPTTKPSCARYASCRAVFPKGPFICVPPLQNFHLDGECWFGPR